MKQIKRYDNTVCFFGADGGVGSTMVSQSVAECMAENGIRTLFFPLSGLSGTVFLPEYPAENTLDRLRNQVQNNLADTNEVEKILIHKNNLDILPGGQALLERRHYHPEDIEALLALLASQYDLIIMDGISITAMEDGLTTGALLASDRRYMVITQQDKSIAQGQRLDQEILQPLKVDYSIVLNKHIRESGTLAVPEQVQMAIQHPVIARIPHSAYGWQCEHDRCSLLAKYGGPDYRNQIHLVCECLLQNRGLALKEEEGRRSMWQSFFRRKEKNA